MTLNILIHRQQKGEPQEGRLRAWVVQEGQKGSELLRGSGKTIADAKQAIAKTMEHDAPGCTIRWTVEDYRIEATE